MRWVCRKRRIICITISKLPVCSRVPGGLSAAGEFVKDVQACAKTHSLRIKNKDPLNLLLDSGERAHNVVVAYNNLLTSMSLQAIDVTTTSMSYEFGVNLKRLCLWIGLFISHNHYVLLVFNMCTSVEILFQRRNERLMYLWFLDSGDEPRAILELMEVIMVCHGHL